jgi:hypothetical protein
MFRLAGIVCVAAHPAYRDLFPNGFNVPFSTAAGHVDKASGAGPLSAFGGDFRLAGYKWTRELCNSDSDSDGQTNGHELGDPCCNWRVGEEPSRSFDLGDPSLNTSHSVSAPPQNCTKVDPTVDPNFWSFYWDVDTSYSTASQDIAALGQGASIALVLLIAAWIHLGLLSDIKRLGVFGFLGMFFLVFAWMDVLSAVFHITLDNPNVNDWPGIGGPARDFQEHHYNPGFLTRKPWHVFFQEVHVPAAGFCTFSLLRPHHSILRVWYLLAILGAHAMMACHRFAHTAPSRVPVLVRWLQEYGVVVSANHHSKHHMTYDCNFSILAGFSDVVLNELVKYIDRYNTIWAPILICYALGPVLFVCTKDFCMWACCKKKLKTG